MVRKSTTRRKNYTAVHEREDAGKAKLKRFSKGDRQHPGFSFTRFWYDGDGERPGIANWVRKKLSPGDDAVYGRAARHEVLLPKDAPGEYASIDFLIDRFDSTMPGFQRHVLVQAKLDLDQSRPWHSAYEDVRTFAKAHFARRFPTILVAHVPSIAAIEGQGNHVHVIVLSRTIGPDGLGGVDHKLCSDHGYRSALDAWRAFPWKEAP